MNYETLFETIKGYVENDFPNTTFTDTTGNSTATFTQKEQVDTFIRQAEQRIFNSVLFPAVRKNYTGTFTASNPYVDMPNDFLAVFYFAVVDASGVYSFLYNKDPSFIRESFPDPAVTGVPQYYALFGPTVSGSPPLPTTELRLLFAPTPASTYTYDIQYYYYPESITTAVSGTSWLGDNFDSVLLYGSLLEAYTYMKGEADIIASYQKRYDDALALAKMLGDGLERSDSYRNGQTRIASRI